MRRLRRRRRGGRGRRARRRASSSGRAGSSASARSASAAARSAVPGAPKASRSAGAWSTARPVRSSLEEGEVVLDGGERAGERRLAGEAGAAGRGDAERACRGAPPPAAAARRAAPPGRRRAAGRARRSRQASAPVGDRRRPRARRRRASTSERAGRRRVLEAVGLGGAGVPGARADPELAVPVAEGEEGEAGGLGPVGRDQRRVAVLAEALHRAVGEADAQRAGGRRGLRPCRR